MPVSGSSAPGSAVDYLESDAGHCLPPEAVRRAQRLVATVATAKPSQPPR